MTVNEDGKKNPRLALYLASVYRFAFKLGPGASVIFLSYEDYAESAFEGVNGAEVGGAIEAQ